MRYKAKHAAHQTARKKSFYKKTVKICAIGQIVLANLLFVPPIISRLSNSNVISTYQGEISQTDARDRESALKKAREYNDLLFQTDGMIIPGVTDELLSQEYYDSLLNLSKTSLMGRIEIPKISVDLPIYHGTNEDALSNGIGHLQGSSLPVGGENTRSILSGHRASPNAELFSRLDELKEGDFVFIEVLNEKLTYRVMEINVIYPENVEALKIIPGKDLITLVTCTPYGTNKYRLIITCERVEYIEEEKTEINKTVSARETSIRVILPLILLFLAFEFWKDFPFTNKLSYFLTKNYKKGKGEK